MAVFSRLEYQMPLVRHHAIGEDAETDPAPRLKENGFERGVVVRRVEDLLSCVRAVQHVVHDVRLGLSRDARHPCKLFA